MRLLSLIHRWTGAFIGLLLALLGLSGAVLVWEGEWINLPSASDALAENVQVIAHVTDRAAAAGELQRITFASDEIGLHQLAFAGGGGAYVRQDGATIQQWAGQWERPELWLFDFHHHLFAGHMGETVTGVAGIAGLLFVTTGLLLWWRGRSRMRIRLWPDAMRPGPIVKHHRDLGVIAAPLLLISMLSGVMMLFEPVRSALLGPESRPSLMFQASAPPSPGEALRQAKALFPDAALRRISVAKDAGDPIVVRMKQPFEWTPNGRTQVSFFPDGRVEVENAAHANRSAGLAEKLYPIHSAKVGGLAWKFVMTLSGLALALLGSLAMFGFWQRRAMRKANRRRPESLLMAASESV